MDNFTNKIKYLLPLFMVLILLFGCQPPAGNTYNILDYGAKADSSFNSRDAIDKAITACSEDGGGIVLFPSGIYGSSTIHLKSNVSLKFEKGAILYGVKGAVYDLPEPNEWDKYQDFGHSHYKPALIYGKDLKNIGIEGPGLIDGRGFAYRNTVPEGMANRGISLVKCKNITFKGFTVTRCGHFGIIVNGCDSIIADSITVDEYSARDGFNVIGSKNVKLTNSTFRGADDGLVLKSDYYLGKSCDVENIRVANCTLTSGSCNAFQIGSETVGNFTNIVVENCKIVEAGKAGIGITSNDGAIVSGLVFRDITMEKVGTPFFIDCSARMRTPEEKAVGKISDIIFEDIEVKGVSNKYSRVEKKWWASTIDGHPDSPVEGLVFKNVNITYPGGWATDGRKIEVSEQPSSIGPRHLGNRPAWGWYIRHAKNIRFQRCSFSVEKEDLRPVIYADDVKGVTLEVCNTPTDGGNVVIAAKNSESINYTGENELVKPVIENGLLKFYKE